jgi:hypothetical protein
MTRKDSAINHLRAVRLEANFDWRFARALFVVVAITYGIALASATSEFQEAEKEQVAAAYALRDLARDTSDLARDTVLFLTLLISLGLIYSSKPRYKRLLETTRYNAFSADGFNELAVKHAEFTRNLVIEAHRIARVNNAQDISRSSVQIAYRQLVSRPGWRWSRVVGIVGAFGLGATTLQVIGYTGGGGAPSLVMAKLVLLGLISVFLLVLDFKQDF